ncbi:MAG: hypothetical protein OHK0023_15920 [Anaerolineae bacterium]
MPTVIIYWSPGRTPEQKEAVIQGVTDVLVQQGGANREHVLIIFQNIEAGDAGRGGVVIAPPASVGENSAGENLTGSE